MAPGGTRATHLIRLQSASPASFAADWSATPEGAKRHRSKPAAGRRSARCSQYRFVPSRDRMMTFEKRKSAALYLTAAVISMCCFAKTTHCLWLKKTVRRGGPDPDQEAVQNTEAQKGRIVFGRVFEREDAVTSQGVDGAVHSSPGDAAAYQADQPGRGTSS